ncbi:hypothetical protein [Azospirillum sp. sgz302134]
MTALTDTDRILLRTALTAARRYNVPSVGVRTDTLERLLAHLAELERGRADAPDAHEPAPG